MHQSNLFDTGPAREPDRLHRLFFALWPDDATRRAIADEAAALRQASVATARWTQPARYHLTLQFLGDSSELRPDVVDAAQRAAATVSAPAFDLPLDRVGSFRNKSIPWWLGCRHTPDGLTVLWERLGAALLKGRVRTEASHSLRPHVTIARDAQRMLSGEETLPSVNWRVDAFVLIHSELGARNAYTVLDRWRLPS